MMLKLIMLFFIFAAVQGANMPMQTELCSGNQAADGEIVRVQFYYETGCPYSISSYVEDLFPVVKELGSYLDITTYPYGIAYTKINGTEVSIECQHKQEECYGNELHACAIEVLKEVIDYVTFNSCMMDYNRHKISNDTAADACGKKLKVDAEPIKKCAKGLKGFQLLLNYGIESSKVKYIGVPWWIVNGKPRTLDDKTLKYMICAALKNPPDACKSN